MGLRRKYKRFRYYCSWRYPRLTRFAQKVAFPVQVGALCITLYAAVTLYQQHYSFEATMRAHESRQIIASQNPTPLAFDTEIPLAAAIDGTHANTSTSAIVERQTNQSNTVVPGLEKHEDDLQPIANYIDLQQPSIVELLDSKWILNQNSQSFVIQLAISSNEAELKKYARSLPLAGPSAMYPFKRTTEGKVTYGLSSGLYNSNAEALSALASLPEGTEQYGSWIRKIADIRAQITDLELQP